MGLYFKRLGLFYKILIIKQSIYLFVLKKTRCFINVSRNNAIFFYFQDQEYALESHSRKQKCFLCLQTWYKNFNFPKCRREMFLIWKVSRALQRTPPRTDWKLNSVDKLMVMDLSSYARLVDFRKEKRGSDILKLRMICLS